MTTETDQGAAGAQGGEQQNPAAAAAAGAAAPAGGAALPQNLIEMLPAELRADPAFKDFKSIDALARSYKHALRFTGNQDPNRMVLWPAEGDEKGMADVLKRLGRPDDANGYNFDNVKIPEGMPWDAEFQKSMVGIFHEAGLSQKQAETILGKYVEMEQGLFSQAAGKAQETAKTSEANLRREWGLKFDENFAIAETVLEKAFGDNVEMIKQLGLHNQDWFVKGLANMGQGMAEADLHFDKGGTGITGALTPAQAKAEISSKMADPNFYKAYTDRDNPGHAGAVKTITELYAAAHPQAKKT